MNRGHRPTPTGLQPQLSDWGVSGGDNAQQDGTKVAAQEQNSPSPGANTGEPAGTVSSLTVASNKERIAKQIRPTVSAKWGLHSQPLKLSYART
jgi:hypothetical protein